MISGLIFKPWICFGSIFVARYKIGTEFNFSTFYHPVFSIPIIEGIIISPVGILGCIVNIS